MKKSFCDGSCNGKMTILEAEIIACILEINTDIGYLIDYELKDEDALESLEMLSNRLNILLKRISDNEHKLIAAKEL